jgi:hypothetical protein
LGQPGRAQWRRSLAPDAPALEPEEAALVVAPLVVEQAECVTGCGEIDMAEESAKSLFTAHSSLSRSARSATSVQLLLLLLLLDLQEQCSLTRPARR